MPAVEEVRSFSMDFVRCQKEIETLVCCSVVVGVKVDGTRYGKDIKQYSGAEFGRKGEEGKRLGLCVRQ